MTYLASSAAALFNAVTLWTGRANQAWGASRVWNSGASWEANYSAAATSAATWQANANNAWGPTRIWNSGASFEANYNTAAANATTWQNNANSAWGASGVYGSGLSYQSQLPPATVLTASADIIGTNPPAVGTPVSAGNTAVSGGIGSWGATTFTVAKAGTYICTARFGLTNDGSSGLIAAQWFRSGSGQNVQTRVFRNPGQLSEVGVSALVACAAGNTLELRITELSGANTYGNSVPRTMEIRFIPLLATPN